MFFTKYEMSSRLRPDQMPHRAAYFTDVPRMLLDTTKDISISWTHILKENWDRICEVKNPRNPEELGAITTQTVRGTVTTTDTRDPNVVRQVMNELKGAYDTTLTRCKANFRTATPQFFKGGLQLLLPITLSPSTTPNLALTVEQEGQFPHIHYRASTMLKMEWAYNNARLVAKPEADWLVPPNSVSLQTQLDAAQLRIADLERQLRAAQGNGARRGARGRA